MKIELYEDNASDFSCTNYYRNQLFLNIQLDFYDLFEL
jgi:hypothetical protein